MSNYRILISYSQDKQVYLARAPELRNCQAEAETRAEALSALEQEIEAQIEVMQQQGVTPPRPLDEQEFDGQLACTVSSDLQRELVFLARTNNLELNDLLPELLARAVNQRWGSRGGGAPRQGRAPREGRGRGRDHGGQRYHDIMENRADFIEYVRRLDSNPGGPRGKGRRGGKR